MGYNVSLISKYRLHLMGVATLMIIFCHAPASGVIMPSVINKLLSYGNLGVDIFLFLSGFGCYYSLMHNHNPRVFLIKRATRLLIPFLIIAVSFDLISLLMGFCSLSDFFLDISTIGYWINHTGAWYVSLLVVLYPLAPYMCDSINKSYCFSLFFIIIVFAGYYVLSLFPDNNLASNIAFPLSRIPSFIIGISVGRFSKLGNEINVLAFFALLPLYFLRKFFHMDFYFGWCLAPCLIVILTFFFDRFNVLLKPFSWLGRISLESYLFNIYLNLLFIMLNTSVNFDTD